MNSKWFKLHPWMLDLDFKRFEFGSLGELTIIETMSIIFAINHYPVCAFNVAPKIDRRSCGSYALG